LFSLVFSLLLMQAADLAMATFIRANMRNPAEETGKPVED